MRVAIGLVCLFLVAQLGHAASPPKGAKTQYLRTTGAGFLMSKDDGAFYAMNYEVRKPFPSKLFCVATFDNPEAPEAPLRKEFEVSSDAAEIKVRSPGVRSIRNNTKYKVHLDLYLDADHTNKLSQHDQDVLFSMPAEVVGQFLDRFGVKIQ